jgi:uncharacterized coiled-coil DUF342 family protein
MKVLKDTKITILKHRFNECDRKFRELVKYRDKIEKQKKEYLDKIIELKSQNKTLKTELDEVTKKYEDLKKETFGYNFFAKVNSKAMLREALGKDK